jgi:hypothetical protein
MKRCALFRPLLSKATSLQSKSRGLKPINRGRARATLNVLKGLKKMLRITTSHSAEAAKNYFDVALKTSDYYTKDVGTWGKGQRSWNLKVTSSGRILWQWLTMSGWELTKSA